MKNLILLLSFFLLIQCSVDRTLIPINESEEITLEKFQKIDSLHKIFIAKKTEPGEKLILCLTFVDKASKKVLTNQRVSFYHTSTAGEYEPSVPNDETTARLSGTSHTNIAGNIYIETILPGDYGSSEDNRHIHTTVYGAHPEAYDILFNQYSSGISKLMNSNNDHLFYADLKKTKDHVLVCFVTIEVKNPKQTEN